MMKFFKATAAAFAMVLSAGPIQAGPSAADPPALYVAVNADDAARLVPGDSPAGPAVQPYRFSRIVADDDDTDTRQLILDGVRKASQAIQCQSNCNARATSCRLRCTRFRNNDPQGVACQIDCNTDYNQCTSDCNSNN